MVHVGDVGEVDAFVEVAADLIGDGLVAAEGALLHLAHQLARRLVLDLFVLENGFLGDRRHADSAPLAFFADFYRTRRGLHIVCLAYVAGPEERALGQGLFLFHGYNICDLICRRMGHVCLSIAAVLRFSFFSEGLEAFSPIGSPQHSFVVESFDLEARFEVGFDAPVDCLLCVFYSNGGVSEHFFDYLESLLFGFGEAAYHVVHQAHFLGLFSFHSPSGEDEFFGQGDSDGSGQSLSAAASGDQAPVGFGQAHFCASGGDADVRIEGKFESSSEGGAVDEAEDGAVDVSEVIEDPSQIVDDVLDLVFGFVEPFLEVGSRAEVPLGAALEDDCPQLRLLVDFLDGEIELAQQVD